MSDTPTPRNPVPAELDAERVSETARMLRCVGHPLRLRILDYLERSGERMVSEVHEALDLEQAVCSQHLTLMHDRGILGRRKEGVNVYYRLGDPRTLKVIACVRGSAA